jgi:tetratricopeptide (TPR) repeat protein
MKHGRWSVLLVTFLFVVALHSLAQIEPIVIPAGTPEDVALQAITKEPDDQKKLAMYEDFVKQFASNPAAVAYGNWQLAQAYQGVGDLQKALDYGDKALASAPAVSIFSSLGQYRAADEEQPQAAGLLGARRRSL